MKLAGLVLITWIAAGPGAASAGEKERKDSRNRNCSTRCFPSPVGLLLDQPIILLQLGIRIRNDILLTDKGWWRQHWSPIHR